jgi:hypothetical protein
MPDVCMSNNDKFQTQVNNMPRTGDDAKDFHSGCVVIQAVIKHTLAMADIPAKNVNVSWAEPRSPVAQVGNFTVTANGRTVTLEITRKRVIESYERVGDSELLQTIRDLAHQLTR